MIGKTFLRTSLVLAFGMFAAAACSSSDKVSSATAFPAPPREESTKTGLDSAVLAGGCFWGVEGVFERIAGVTDVVSGYSGGTAENAKYNLVGSGQTGHAEAVLIKYDPAVVSYGTLLQVFFHIAHDPTQLNYQGPDHGPQYRSAIFYADEDQKRVAEDYIRILDDAKVFPKRIVTKVVQLSKFYPAEDYHQDFMRLNPTYPYIVMNDQPKVDSLVREYPALLSQTAKSETMKGETWYGLQVFSSAEEINFPVVRSDKEWRTLLEPFPYQVLRQAETEYPGSGPLTNEHRVGTFYSAATGQPLFRSEAKFESGTGWPSFSKPIDQDAVILIGDRSLGMIRVEVLDSSSGSHLGHVFDDGPQRSSRFEEGTGLRYCMNSAALIFVPDGGSPPELVSRYAAERNK